MNEMIVTINKANLAGQIKAIPAKSAAHRFLICAGLADQPTEIICDGGSADIDATCSCLSALGVEVQKRLSGFLVTPHALSHEQILPCRESGSTFRFFLPVACALGAESSFILAGRLPNRPMEPLYAALEAHGIEIMGQNTAKVSINGKLRGGKYLIPGNVSSQFISGLLLALPLLGQDSEIEIRGGCESKGYVDLTLSIIKKFGIRTSLNENTISIPGNQKYLSPGTIEIEGDWSNTAFWLCAAAISGTVMRSTQSAGALTCTGLKGDSCQGDKAIGDILSRFGARVEWGKDRITVLGCTLRGITLDAKDIPDLVPSLAAVAALAKGQTNIINAGRLRLKESDRLETIALTLNKLGAQVEETADGLVITGKKSLLGGKIKAYGDHRIVMMAAIAAAGCDNPVIIEDAEAVAKSYPNFFADFIKLGGVIEGEGI